MSQDSYDQLQQPSRTLAIDTAPAFATTASQTTACHRAGTPDQLGFGLVDLPSDVVDDQPADGRIDRAYDVYIRSLRVSPAASSRVLTRASVSIA